MKILFKKMAVATVLFGAGMIALGMAVSAAGIRVNTSRSIPLGFYIATSKPAEKYDYVLFCPPNTDVMAEAKRRGYLAAGFCAGDYGYLMKKILAAGDDVVAVTDEGVNVNGVPLPYSAPLMRDSEDRDLPRLQPANFVIRKDELLLMSDVSSTSFDARYFGPVSRAQVNTVIRPLLTW